MNIKKSNKKLYRIILLMILSGTLVIANVLFTMVEKEHFWSGKNIMESSIVSSQKEEVVAAKRGNIYDRSFNVIAEDVKAYTIVAHFSEKRVKDGKPDYVKDAKMTAKKIKKVLKDEVDEKNVRSILENGIKSGLSQSELGPGTKRLDKEVKNKIEKMKIPGIEFIEAKKRYYSSTPFSSSLLGFASYDEDMQKIDGKMGMEKYLNEELAGKDGIMSYQKTAGGTILPGTKHVKQESVDGYDVILTIDSNLQSIVEQQLNDTMNANNAKSAWALVLEVETGKVLAWGSYPTFDQNKPKEIPTYLDNFATKQMEPGSVMKPFVYATAIDTGVYPKGKSYTAGKFTYDVNSAGRIVRVQNGTETPYAPIQDALGNNFGTITFERGLAVSSNIAICELLSNYIHYEDFGEYLDKFGFFKPIKGIHLEQTKGEKHVDNASDYLSSGFGQASSISMIQLVQAYTAIFNDGKMMRPYIVDSIEDLETGEVIEDTEPKEVGQPIKESTAHEVCEILKGVTEPGGTGDRLKMNGVDMLMKTGTGEIYNEETGGYDKDYYTTSVVAAAPADDPKIMVFWGMVSTNILGFSEVPFQTIMKASLIANGISGTNDEVNTGQASEITDKESWNTYTMPNVQNHSIAFAKEQLANKNIKIEWIGEGNTIVNQYPLPQSTVYSNDRVFLMTDSKKIVMPDMTGWTRKDIMAFWQMTGIEPKVSGSGKVKKQNIKAGEKISKNSDLKLTLE